jgi:hypothetical protein
VSAARGKLALIVALLAVSSTASSGCTSKPTPRVFVYGDSLVFQASKYVDQLLRARHFEPQIASLSGTATCDWFDNVKRARDTFHPDIVVMSFSGNALGPCMLHPDRTALSIAEYVAKYRKDTETAISIFPNDVRIYAVGAPVSSGGDDRVFQIYRAVAKKHRNVHFVDGGIYITPHHRFAMTLPCLPGEPCTGPVVHGVRTNIVRSPDKAHFCPVDPGFGKPCPMYSSGAYRFALAIAQAVEQGAR